MPMIVANKRRIASPKFEFWSALLTWLILRCSLLVRWVAFEVVVSRRLLLVSRFEIAAAKLCEEFL
jgi:hypothetical protein